MAKKTWNGTWPVNCDICGTHLPNCEYFIDGADQQGHWGLFCPQCSKDYHIRLGVGRGQKYDSKTLEKVEG